MKKIFSVLLWLLPVSMVAGILDYRFHNYYWPGLNFFRVFPTKYMFDFSSVSEFFLLIVLIGYILLMIFSPEDRPKARWSWTFVPIILMAFGIVMAYSHFYGLDPRIKSFEDQVLTNYIGPILAFLMLFFLFRGNPDWREKLEKSFLVTFTVFGGVILWEFFTDFLPGENVDWMGRLVWPYIDPFIGMKAESANWLGFLFGPILLLGVVRFLKNRNWIYILPVLVCAAVILLSKSYTSILVVSGLVFIHLFFKFGRQTKKWVALGGLVGILLLVATQYNTPKFQILIGQYDYSKPNSIERRIQIYKVNAEAFIDEWLVGIGPGNYQNYFRQNMYQTLDAPIPEDELPPHPHNIALQFWSDLGIFGLAAILMMYLVTLWGVLAPSASYYLVFAYPLAHGLIDTPYGMEEASMMFWIALALAVTQVREINKIN